ncbi:DUF2251 domain-containing protein [Mucilaginibacter sp. FT3.2]|uniref:DUF2251 domain-containing protein n=1 Tax=Mucilaginibacter sp. FT3.2 TaxID=2723090 RepID=UPI001613A309|nr:DUF2251 domain-containing protein [Mucilaginibacter sp. FT3.2]MBB6233319.1 hypothetical protein [Mucilaginibacter sp. FT3.2]
MILEVEEEFIVGEDTFLDSVSPDSSHGVVFEDNLTTGYFYAIGKLPKQEILDAVHIYDDENVTDKGKRSNIKIVWTDDWQQASLLINNYCHAIFDFKNKIGYSRNAFPPCNGKWKTEKDRIELSDALIDELLTGK